MILGIAGENATGKTTMAYTAPERVIGFGFDIGADRALYGKKYDQLFKDREIFIKRYEPLKTPLGDIKGFREEALSYWNTTANIAIYELPPPIQLDPSRIYGNLELWTYFMVLLGKAVEDPDVRSCVLDTATLCRRVKADAYLQELQEKQIKENPDASRLRKQLIQIEWGHPNDTIRTFYQMFAGVGKNLICTYHLTDERKDYPNPRGEMESRLTGARVINEGNTEPDRYWDVGVLTHKDKQKHEVYSTYYKCGYNLELEGQRLPDMQWDMMVAQIDGSLGNRLNLERRYKNV